MNLVQHDDLSYEVCRLTYGEVLNDTAVKAWMNEAGKNEFIQLLKQEVDELNIRRGNEDKPWLPTHVFYLLQFDCDRHARNKTEQNRWERLQVKAALKLAVPHRESSLAWMIYQSTR